MPAPGLLAQLASTALPSARQVHSPSTTGVQAAFGVAHLQPRSPSGQPPQLTLPNGNNPAFLHPSPALRTTRSGSMLSGA